MRPDERGPLPNWWRPIRASDQRSEVIGFVHLMLTSRCQWMYMSISKSGSQAALAGAGLGLAGVLSEEVNLDSGCSVCRSMLPRHGCAQIVDDYGARLVQRVTRPWKIFLRLLRQARVWTSQRIPRVAAADNKRQQGSAGYSPSVRLVRAGIQASLRQVTLAALIPATLWGATPPVPDPSMH